MRHLSKVDLTDEQRVDIKALVKQEVEANKPKFKQIKALHKQIKTLRQTDSLDEQAVRDTASKIAELRSDLMISKHRTHQAIKALLTNDQREKLEK